MQNKGYTIPELIIVAVVLGFISIIAINKASYAFVDVNKVSEETQGMILMKSATAYATSIKDTIKTEKTKYITANDLVDAGYLMDSTEYKNAKIKLEYKADVDNIVVTIIK